MQRGCQIGDYLVTIGTVVLDNEQLHDDRLVVRLLGLDTYNRGDETTCGDLYPVRVRMA